MWCVRVEACVCMYEFVVHVSVRACMCAQSMAMWRHCGESCDRASGTQVPFGLSAWEKPGRKLYSAFHVNCSIWVIYYFHITSTYSYWNRIGAQHCRKSARSLWKSLKSNGNKVAEFIQCIPFSKFKIHTDSTYIVGFIGRDYEK